MHNYLIEVIEMRSHFITVTAPDEFEARKLAELQQGDYGHSTAPELSYKKPKRLSDGLTTNTHNTSVNTPNLGVV